MTQVQIDGLIVGRTKVALCYEKYRTAAALWQPIIDAIENVCDHKNPDGSSAVLADFIDDICLICHRVQQKEAR